MSRVLQPTTVTGSQSTPAPTFAGGGQVYDSGSLTIAGDSCYVQLLHGSQSQVNEDEFLRLGPGQYPLVGHDGDFVIGVNFAADPLATTACNVSGILYEPGKAGILSGSPSAVTTTPAASSGVITGIIPAAGTIPTAGTGFAYTHTNGTGVYAFTFSTPFPGVPVVGVWRMAATASSGGGWNFSVNPTANGFEVTMGSGGDSAFEFAAWAVI